MTAVETILVVIVAILVVVVAVAAVAVVRVHAPTRSVRRSARQTAQDDFAARRESTRSSRWPRCKGAADDANLAVEQARAAASAARTDAVAAKAEATAARAEAQRILGAAHAEAESILERAHRQAQADAEQERLAGRRAGEREIEILTAAVKEQVADTERRQLRLDERERLHGRRGRADRRARSPDHRDRGRAGRPGHRAGPARDRARRPARTRCAGSWSGSPA